jgi:hypothetical protein
VSIYQDLLSEGDGATERFVEVTRREHSAVVMLNEPERLNVLSGPEHDRRSLAAGLLRGAALEERCDSFLGLALLGALHRDHQDPVSALHVPRSSELTLPFSLVGVKVSSCRSFRTS